MLKISHSSRRDYEESWINHLNIKARQKIHPLLRALIRINRILSGYKIVILNSHQSCGDRPAIFAITHILKEDIEISAEVLGKPFYLLTDDFSRMHGTPGGFFVELNGVIYVDKSDKADMARSKETCVNLLDNGANIMWFPEGVWNLSPNLPVLPLPFGIIEVAMRTNAVIVPMAIEQYGKRFFVNFGENFDVCAAYQDISDEREMKIQAISQIRDILATLKWEIWESQPIAHRENYPPFYWEQHVDEILNHWQHYDLEEALACIFQPKGVVTQKDVFAFLRQAQP